jgi:hypothetical protein
LQDVQQNLLNQADQHFVQVAADYDRVATNLEMPLLSFMAKSANHYGRVVDRMLGTIDGELGVSRINLERVTEQVSASQCPPPSCPMSFSEYIQKRYEYESFAQVKRIHDNDNLLHLAAPNSCITAQFTVIHEPGRQLPPLPEGFRFGDTNRPWGTDSSGTKWNYTNIEAPIYYRCEEPQRPYRPEEPRKPEPTPKGEPHRTPSQPMPSEPQPQPTGPVGFPVPFPPPRFPPFPQPQPQPSGPVGFPSPPIGPTGPIPIPMPGGEPTGEQPTTYPQPTPTGETPCEERCPPPQVTVEVKCPEKEEEKEEEKKEEEAPECPVTTEEANKWEPKVKFRITSLPLEQEEPCEELFPLGSDFWRGMYEHCKQKGCKVSDLLSYTPPRAGEVIRE